ncbi:MAG: WD40 repeat domain-containing serine/threonine protein kinase [Limisphaerales bacterium]
MTAKPTPPRVPDYELLHRIGGGSYGDVWLARGVTGIYRAVKIVTRDRFADERPFLRELDGISRFQKVALGQSRQLALLHVGRNEAGNEFHYVMELADDAVTGSEINPDAYVALTLKELRHRRRHLPAEECLRIAVDLTRALTGLHALGLVHRDVKPSNIIFVQGVPKLADVGLVSSTDHTLTSVGTPGYLPPEGTGTMPADIFSLGRVLYELLTGLSPADFPRLPEDAAARPDTHLFFELNEVILRAGDPDLARRYSTSQALLDDLLLIQAGRSVRELVFVRERLARYRRFALRASVVGLAVVAFLGVRNLLATRRLYAQEAEFRRQAEGREAEARYAADLQLAQLGLATGDFGVANTALRRHLPAPGERDRRGFEWYALTDEARGDPARVFGQPGDPPCWQVCVSPDGRQLAALRRTGVADGETHVWGLDGPGRADVFTNTYDLGGFSPDGRRLTSSTYAKELRVLDLASGGATNSPAVTNQLVAVGGDGQTLLLARTDNGHVFHVWDAAAGTEVDRWETGPETDSRILSGAALSADRRWLAASFLWTEGVLYRRELLVWNLAGKQLQFRTSDVARVQTLAFSPDGKSLAVGMAGEAVLVLDTATGNRLRTLSEHNGRIHALAFSPDSRRLATGGSDQTLRLWDLTTGQAIRQFRGHQAAIRAAAWFPDGGQIASASEDGTVRLWPVDTPPEPAFAAGLWQDTLGDFVFTPDASRLYLSGEGGEAIVVDASTFAPGGALPGAFQPLAWAADGRTLLALSTNRSLGRWNIATGSSEITGLSLPDDDWVRGFAVSGSGRRAAFSSDDGEVRFWDLVAAREIGTVTNHLTRVMGLAFSADDTTAATGDDAGWLRTWRLSDLTLTAERRLSATIHSLAWSPEGRWLATGLEDGMIQVVEAGLSGDSPLVLQAHSREVSHLLFDAAGRRLVSAGYDGLMVFWSVPGFRRLVAMPFETSPTPSGDVGLTPIRWSADETRLGAYAADGRLRIWRRR